MKQMIIEERREQIVTGSHRMGIPGQMKVDVFHRGELGMSSTGSSSLCPKHRAERWLPEG